METLLTHPFAILAADFMLSLAATWILFRYLKSATTISRPAWRASGAIAGFIVLFGMAFSFSDAWLEKYVYDARRYNISGTVMLDSCCLHEGTVVEELPPTARCLTERDGNFMLTGIRYDEREAGEMTLSFDHVNFIPVKHVFRPGTFTVDRRRMQIRLHDTVKLLHIPWEAPRRNH